MENKNETEKFVKMLFQLLKKRWFDALKKGENPEESAKDLEEVVKNSKDAYSAMIALSLKYLKEILEPVRKINTDRWKLVTRNKEFKKDIELLRKKVPHLDPEEDIIVCESPDGKVIYDESKWLNFQSQEFRDGFYKGIVAVLNRFKLPYSFYNKLEKYILYPSFDDKVPVPIMNVSDWSPFDENRELTTAEKRLFKGVLQRKFGVEKGRLPKDEKQASQIEIAKQKIKIILDRILKNKIRRKRNLERDLKIQEEMDQRKKETKIIYDDYLYYVEKENKKGNISDDEFERLKRLNPSDVQKYIDEYTSKDVAEKILGDRTKDATIRKIFQRIQKEIEKSEK